MTVAALIKQLSALDPDLEVITEGCDCDGTASLAQVEEAKDGLVAVIRRHYGWRDLSNND